MSVCVSVLILGWLIIIGRGEYYCSHHWLTGQVGEGRSPKTETETNISSAR